MKHAVVTWSVGLLFALGLGISGMTQPQKVIGFLDLTQWDPSLIFVMLGAVGTHALFYPLIRKRPSPLFDHKWHVPSRKDITPRLLLGSALFGIGWGIGGICPGPGLTALVSGDLRVVGFLTAMLFGMWMYQRTEKLLPIRG